LVLTAVDLAAKPEHRALVRNALAAAFKDRGLRSQAASALNDVYGTHMEAGDMGTALQHAGRSLYAVASGFAQSGPRHQAASALNAAYGTRMEADDMSAALQNAGQSLDRIEQELRRRGGAPVPLRGPPTAGRPRGQHTSSARPLMDLQSAAVWEFVCRWTIAVQELPAAFDWLTRDGHTAIRR